MLRATTTSLLVGPLLAAAALHPVQQDARKFLQRSFNTTDEISQQRRHADEFAASHDEDPLRAMYSALRFFTTLFESRDSIDLPAAEAHHVLDAACSVADLLLAVRPTAAARESVRTLWAEQQQMRCWPVFVKQYKADPSSCLDLTSVVKYDQRVEVAKNRCRANCEYRAHPEVEFFHNGELLHALAALAHVLARQGRSADAARYITAASQCVQDRLFSTHSPLDSQGRVVTAAAADGEWSWRAFLLTCDPCVNSPQAYNHAGQLAVAVHRLVAAIEANGDASLPWARLVVSDPGGPIAPRSTFVECLRAVAAAFVAHWQDSARTRVLEDGTKVLAWKYRDFNPSSCAHHDTLKDRWEDINHAAIDVEQLSLLFDGGRNPYGLTVEYMQALMNTFLRSYVVDRSATDSARFACDLSGTTTDKKSCGQPTRTGDGRVFAAAKWLILPNTLMGVTSSVPAAPSVSVSIGPLCAAMVADILPAVEPLLVRLLRRPAESNQSGLETPNLPGGARYEFMRYLYPSPIVEIARLPDECIPS